MNTNYIIDIDKYSKNNEHLLVYLRPAFRIATCIVILIAPIATPRYQACCVDCINHTRMKFDLMIESKVERASLEEEQVSMSNIINMLSRGADCRLWSCL